MKRYRLKPVAENLWEVQEKGWIFWKSLPGRYVGKLHPALGYNKSYVHSIEEGITLIEAYKRIDANIKNAAAKDKLFLKSNRSIEL